MDQIQGYVERLTYQSSETGYTVAKLKVPQQQESVCIVGTMPSLYPGETVKCKGVWKQHSQYGRQFVVNEYDVAAPADVIGITKYLQSGLIKGIGRKYAERIVDKFGTATLDVIDKQPHRLLDIEGIGKARYTTICSCWEEQRSIRDVMVFLQGHGVSPIYAQKIFRCYGDTSIEKVTENPYRLARDIFGIGFLSADKIAKQLGIEHDSEKRIDAGIIFVLSELSSNGHVCYPVDDFITVSRDMLKVDENLIKVRLSVLELEGDIITSPIIHEADYRLFIWMRALYASEMGIVNHLRRIMRSPTALRNVDTDAALEWGQKRLNIELAEQQKEACILSLSKKLHIITGGPGTGKSTITNIILTITSKITDRILLAAPTGRAAKRMTEITGREAKTIHSLLEFDFGKMRFKKNRDDPLDCDLIIIDESSMIDTPLMHNLLKAIPNTSRVIFVGDIDQLPSVGPGNVLREMIYSKVIPVTQLNEIFRQAKGSQIIVNAHQINRGEFPDITFNKKSDFCFIEADEAEDVLNKIVRMVTYNIPTRYGFDPIKDIQVLVPMKRGPIGIERFNDVLQASLNRSKGNPVIRMGRTFRLHDKVMQIRNNYKREVYNGDVGRICRISEAEQELYVDMEGKEILYKFTDIDELVLAYAVSVHKYQGSECPCIVIPVHTSHFKLLHRNLLYTAITRGKKFVVLVGMKKAIAIAIHNNEVEQRYTGLKHFLMAQEEIF